MTNPFMTPGELDDLAKDSADDEVLKTLAAGEKDGGTTAETAAGDKTDTTADAKSNADTKVDPKTDAKSDAADTTADTKADTQQATGDQATQTDPIVAGVESSPPTARAIDLPVTPAVDDYATKRSDLVKKLASTRKAYAQGDADLDEDKFAQQEADILGEITQLDTQQQRHKLDTAAAAKHRDNVAADETAAWDADYKKWAGVLKEKGGPDYAADEERFQQLLGVIGIESGKALRAKETLSRTQLLDRAHVSLAKMLGETTSVKPTPRGDPPRPKTLVGLPAAQNAGAESQAENEFSNLDGLDDVERSAAYLKMTPAQQRRYLGD